MICPPLLFFVSNYSEHPPQMLCPPVKSLTIFCSFCTLKTLICSYFFIQGMKYFTDVLDAKMNLKTVLDFITNNKNRKLIINIKQIIRANVKVWVKYSGSINSNSIFGGSRKVKTIFLETVAIKLIHKYKWDFPSQRIIRKKLQTVGIGGNPLGGAGEWRGIRLHSMLMLYKVIQWSSSWSSLTTHWHHHPSFPTYILGIDYSNET